MATPRFIRVSVGVLALLLTADAVAQTPRKRIGLEGMIVRDTMGLPKWQATQSVDNLSEQGDSLILHCRAEPRERLTVGAYLEYSDIEGRNNDWAARGNWRGVAASEQGQNWGYQSVTLKSVGDWRRFDNPSQADTREYDVQLFLPYAAVGLPAGTYAFRYRVRVWANGMLVDDFVTDEQTVASFGPGEYFRERRGICRSAQGPALCTFRLLGTDDPSEEDANNLPTGAGAEPESE